MLRNRVLVIGSEGFIGKRLMRELKADVMDKKLGSDVRDGIKRKYDTIIMLACNQADTDDAWIENHQMSLALEEYRSKFFRTRLIYISSAAVYTNMGMYSSSKQFAERRAIRFEEHTIVRLSNVFGNGDGHGAPDRFIRGEKTINGDGEQIRDLIPVEQVVYQILMLLRNPQNGILHISSGEGTTVNEMFKRWGKGKPKYDKKANIGVRKSILVPGWLYYD